MKIMKKLAGMFSAVLLATSAERPGMRQRLLRTESRLF